MGNCMQRGMMKREEEEEEDQIGIEQGQQQEEATKGFVKESEFANKGGLKVKVVLTKQELEWLMLQLKGNEGKKLEDVLGEIGKGRAAKAEAWKPSLESIMEGPDELIA